MSVSPPLARMADEQYVSLTTFRRSGEPVSTAVWIARDGDALVVTTPAASGKVKRLRRDPRVELRPCGRTGTVADGTPAVTAVAEAVPPTASATVALQRKYGLPYRAIMILERVLGRGRRERVIVRITAPPASS